MNDHDEVGITKYDQARLTELGLPGYEKLIRRVISLNGFVFPSGERFFVKALSDLAILDPKQFAKLPAVGGFYVSKLIALQQALLPLLDNIMPVVVPPILPPTLQVTTEQRNLLIEELRFPIKHLKLLKKIATVASHVRTIGDLLNLEPTRFKELPKVSKLYVRKLEVLQASIPRILRTQAWPSSYFMEFSEIDTVLTEDVTVYVETLSESKREFEIVRSRWGFNHQRKTLEDLGREHNLTRERIRQIEEAINYDLLGALRLPAHILWGSIRENMTADLTILLPKLAKHFRMDKLFYAFIELCCEVKKGRILEITETAIPIKQVNLLFCNTPSPMALDAMSNELASNYGYSKASALHGLRRLAKQHKIIITDQGVYPLKIGSIDAIPHALTAYPEGIHRLDIVATVNEKMGYSSTSIEGLKIQTFLRSALSNSDFIYLCATNRYRNVLFFDVERFDTPKIMQQFIDYLNKNKISQLSLRDYYAYNQSQYGEIEYFDLRYLVKKYGEEFGLYFDGKSAADKVGLDPDLKFSIREHAAFKVLNESKCALSKPEIDQGLAREGVSCTQYYLTNLLKEGKVIRIDQLLYTTPEKAFCDIDIETIMQAMQEIMNSPNSIVDADMFREHVNITLDMNYSKYFYASLLTLQLKELGWYRRGALFSQRPIPYKNLLDAARQLCDLTLSNKKNVSILKAAIASTDAAIFIALQHLRAQSKS